jgi:hypothetical protein
VKRFIVFQYDDYYPCGGLGDIKGFYDSLEDAGSSLYQNVEALDTQTGEVWSFDTTWHLDFKDKALFARCGCGRVATTSWGGFSYCEDCI